MPLGTVYPFLPLQLFDGNGDPLSFGTIAFFAAGTATPLATYQDSSLTIANTNPVVLDAAGRWVQGVYLQPVPYKIIIADQFATIIATYDFVYPSNALGVTFSSIIATAGVITALPLPANNGGDLVIYMTNPTLTTIQGITAGTANQGITIIATGAGQVDLAHQSGGAAAANRLINYATVAATSLASGSGTVEGGTARYVYDVAAARWRLVAHEQGAWIVPTFAATDYTAATGNWVVAAGDRASASFRLSGKTLQYQTVLTTTDVSATPASLRILVPGGYQLAGTQPEAMGRLIDNGAAASVLHVVPGASALTQYTLFRFDLANYTASAGATSLTFSSSAEVT